MKRAFDVFAHQSRVQFVGIKGGVAVFHDPFRIDSTKGPRRPDGPGTFRMDEKSCAERLKNQKTNDGLERVDPAAFEYDISQTSSALRAIQDFKIKNGIPLDTPALESGAVGRAAAPKPIL